MNKEINEAVEELKNSILDNIKAKKEEAKAKIEVETSRNRRQKSLELLMALMRD